MIPVAWTIEDAVRFLIPPMTMGEVQALVVAARIPSIGWRRRPTGGRPPREYDAALIMRAHAGIAPLLADSEVLPETQP
jgi:hypothetical protein